MGNLTKREILDKIYDVSWAAKWLRDGSIIEGDIEQNLNGEPRRVITSWGHPTYLTGDDPLYDLFVWAEDNL